MEKALRISNIIEQAIDYRLLAPFAAYCAYLSSAVHIHGVFAKNMLISSRSSRALATNNEYLEKMKSCWGICKSLIDSLEKPYAHAAHEASLQDNNRPGVLHHVNWTNKRCGVSEYRILDAE